MSIVEIIFRPISFLFLIPTIFLLTVLALNFWTPAPKLNNIFDSVCAYDGLNLPILSSYNVPKGTLMVQFLQPKDFTISDREFRYYQEAFKILEILYNPSSPKNINFNNLKQITRINYGYLRQCATENCLCHVNPGINGFELINATNTKVNYISAFKMASCFHLMYNHERSRNYFKEKFEEQKNNNSLTNYQLFSQSFNYSRDELKTFCINYPGSCDEIDNKIINCIDFMESKSFATTQLTGNEGKYDFLSEKSSGVEYNYSIPNEEFFNEYYYLTSASLFSEIINCEPIPNENDCTHTKDTNNYLNLIVDEGYPAEAFIGYSQPNQAITPTLMGMLDKANNIISINLENISSKRFMQISAGKYYTCAIFDTSEAVCWGNNIYGNLGNGGNVNTNELVFVSGEYDFNNIDSGETHTCGLLDNGSAVCWGQGYPGKLGNGEDNDSNVPVFVSGQYSFSIVNLGWDYTCGVLTNGSGVFWGQNSWGKFGIGVETSYSYVPVFVSGDYIFSSIKIGEKHSCGVLTNGSALCWGNGESGKLGIGSNSNSNVPVFVSGEYNFSNISPGFYHTCGLLINGSAVCWGYGYNGRLGNGGNVDSNVPVFVSGEYVFSSIDSGYDHTCGVLTNGSAVCWGFGGNGRLGNGVLQTNYAASIPVFVSGEYVFKSVSTGEDHTCGVLTNGKAMCWGKNNNGQLGDGTNNPSAIPVLVKSILYNI